MINNNRKHQRLPFKNKVVIGSQNEVISAIGCNLSKGGVFAETLQSHSFKLGQIVKCVFSHNKKDVLQVQGQIRRIILEDPNKPEQKVGLGIEFTASSKSIQQQLYSYIDESLQKLKSLQTILKHSKVDFQSIETELSKLWLNYNHSQVFELKREIDLILKNN